MNDIIKKILINKISENDTIYLRKHSFLAASNIE